MWFVSDINMKKHGTLCVEDYYNTLDLISITIQDEDSGDKRVIPKERIHGLKDVFGVDLEKGLIFESTIDDMLLYSAIDFVKEVEDGSLITDNLYKYVVFTIAGTQMTLGGFFFKSKLYKVIGSSYLVLLDKYVYKIVDQKLFTKLRVLKR